MISLSVCSLSLVLQEKEKKKVKFNLLSNHEIKEAFTPNESVMSNMGYVFFFTFYIQ